jgi:patatin-like phospholipase/acyl hydrolase
MLKQIEQQRPGFLRKTELFAGTSSGSTTALVLATQDDPSTKLADLERLWGTDITSTIGNTVPGFLTAIFGFGSLFSNEPLSNTLAKTEYLGDIDIANLKKRVAIPTFDISVGPNGIWSPAVFTNLGHPEPGEPAPPFTRASEVALASSASPIVMPIFKGFVDGGVYANNPSMVAASTIIYRTRKLAEKVVNHDLPVSVDGKEGRRLTMLSIAGGQSTANLRVSDASWGYGQWMFNLLDPLLAMNMFLQGGMQAVDLQGEILLGPNGYWRVDPQYVAKGPGIPWLQSNPDDLRASAYSPAGQQAVADAVKWIDAVGWLAD